MRKTLEVLVQIIISVIVLVGIFYFTNSVMTKQENAECRNWKIQEGQNLNNPYWYSTQWQKDQCKQFGINFER